MKQIRRDDIENLNRKNLEREKMKVGVVGEIKEKDMGVMIERIFGEMKEQEEMVKVKDEKIEIGKKKRMNLDMKKKQIRLV